MKNILKKLNTDKKLGIFALSLGFIAIFAGTPDNKVKATINVKELSLLTENQVDRVSAEDLADWIIKGKADFRLLDIRSANEFKEYHIPVAENFSAGDLYKANFLPTEKIIICGNDGVQTAQGWFLLKAKNYKSVYVLEGGIKSWKNDILFPQIPDSSAADQKKHFDMIVAVSKYFGGTPITGSEKSTGINSIKMPVIKLPEIQPNSSGKKAKREGC